MMFSGPGTGVYPVRRWAVAFVAICCVGWLAACSEKPPSQLTLGHSLNEDHPVHQAMVYMGEELEALSGGELSIKVFANGQLGTERELIELLQIGAISMTKVSSLSLENFAEEMKLYSIPYLFDDQDHYWRVLESEAGQSVLTSLEPVLLKGLGYFDAGSRSFYTVDGPVLTPDDIKGKKVRVLPSQGTIRMVELMGGSATPIAFGELYTALQQGVVDGAENNAPSYFLARHYEVAPYFSLDEHTSAPDVVLISLREWNRLTEEQKGWVNEAMRRAVIRQRELWNAAEADSLSELEKNGVQIFRPDKAPFQAAVASMRDAYEGQRLGDLIQQADALREGETP